MLHYYIHNWFAGPSRANLLCTGAGARHIIYSFDELDDLLPRPPPYGFRPLLRNESDSDYYWQARTLTVRNRRTLRIPFIGTEAAVNGDASNDEDDDDAADFVGFIVAYIVY